MGTNHHNELSLAMVLTCLWCGQDVFFARLASAKGGNMRECAPRGLAARRNAVNKL